MVLGHLALGSGLMTKIRKTLKKNFFNPIHKNSVSSQGQIGGKHLSPISVLDERKEENRQKLSDD